MNFNFPSEAVPRSKNIIQKSVRPQMMIRSPSKAPKDFFERYQNPNKRLGKYDEKTYTITRKFIKNQYSGNRLYTSIFLPKHAIAANLVCIHGWLDSFKLFELADKFASSNVAVYLFDMSGFGFSDGVPFNPTIEELLIDLKSVLTQVRNKRPTFLYGHSLGAVVALTFLLLNPTCDIEGLMISSPLVSIPKEIKQNLIKSLFMRYISKFFDIYVASTMVNPTAITKNNFYVRQLLMSQNNTILGLKLANDLLESFEFIKEEIHNFKFPLLVMHGTADIYCKAEESKWLAKSVRSELKRFVLLKDFCHEVYLERGERDVFREMKGFIFKVLPKLISKDRNLRADFRSKISRSLKILKYLKYFTLYYLGALTFGLYAQDWNISENLKDPKFLIWPLYGAFKISILLAQLLVHYIKKEISQFFSTLTQ